MYFVLRHRAQAAVPINFFFLLGTAYMAVAGMYRPRPDHALVLVDYASQALEAIKAYCSRVEFICLNVISCEFERVC